MGTEERKSRERKRRREQILRAVMELMRTQDFEKTTMDEIAQKAELSKGTLYLYFNDKATLHQAIKKNALAYMHTNFVKIFKQDKPGATLVKQMAMTFLEIIAENTTITKAMFIYEHLSEDEPDNRTVADECTELENELFMLLVRTIQIGIQDNSIKNATDPRLMAMMIYFQMSGMLQYHLSGAGHKTHNILQEYQITIPELMEHFLNIQFSSTDELTP